MKNFLLLGLLLMAIGCTSKTKYTQQSPEIDIVKSIIGNYVNGEWDEYAAHYAEGATVFFNTTEENPSSIQEIIAGQKLSIEPLSSYSFVRDKEELEMVLTDEGETWVNYWGLWKGTIAANNKTFEMPVHITSQFVDGKIVKTFGYWESAPMQIELMKIQEAAAEMAEIETPE
ncbi:nuclear transport factor 2-like protein [Algoriphagus antarcticus]|nr:nuclear transport factor 2 family protein [Algoriphagus antarcticus]